MSRWQASHRREEKFASLRRPSATSITVRCPRRTGGVRHKCGIARISPPELLQSPTWISPGIQIYILFQTPKNLRTTPSLKSDATFHYSERITLGAPETTFVLSA